MKMMGVLGEIKSKQKRFCVGGREVLCIDADFPIGESPAAKHFLHLVKALCYHAEREQLPAADDALIEAVGTGQGHRFAKWHYCISLSEASVGRRCRVTLATSLFFFDTRTGERIESSRFLETLWDAEGVLQVEKKRGKKRRPWKNRKGNGIRAAQKGVERF